MKVVKVFLFISGITIVVVVLSIKTYPEWLAIPGGLLILSSLAFNWVLDAGGKIKNWIELLEKKGTISKEDELQRNLNLKRRIEKDFGDWLNYFPENRKETPKCSFERSTAISTRIQINQISSANIRGLPLKLKVCITVA